MLATGHCWYMIDDTAVGKQCSRLKKLVSGVITPGCLLLLREWHRRVWRLLEQHELVAVKTRVRWRGWRLIICTKNQRIRIRRAESGDWRFIAIYCKCVLNLWHPNSFRCAAKSTWIIKTKGSSTAIKIVNSEFWEFFSQSGLWVIKWLQIFFG